jgi:putative ABC transport system substrate-binding protein
LLLALGVGALAAPFAAFAQQQGKVWRVGFIAPQGRPASMDSHFYGAFPRGMRELGYVEGRNLVIEWRFGDNKVERYPELAAELVGLNVDAIVAATPLVIAPVQKATSTIPIVMTTVGDPVGSGFVKSLAHPGGNTTGTSLMITGEISAKRLQLFLQMARGISRVAILLNPSASQTVALDSLRTAAREAGVKTMIVEARTPQEIDKAFAAMKREKAGAVMVLANPVFNSPTQLRQIADLALKGRLPSMHTIREYAEAGGLMSYGPSFADSFYRAAYYVDKILKGAKPGDLPVEQPTKFEFAVNRKTAKALGLTIPQELLLSADKVIE